MKVERLLGIVMILLERERVGAQELAALFEVSPRTIYRDVDAINLAGIPIRSVSGVGGGFEIMRAYKVDKKVFSTSDLSAILLGLSSLSGMIRGDELGNALAKVKSCIPGGSAKDVDLRVSRLQIDPSPWIGSRNIQPYLEIIQTALRENRLLSFEYAGRHGEKTARTVEPYRLVLKGSHWYLQAYCRTREDDRLFKLTRMGGLQMREERFTPRVREKSAWDLGVAETAAQTKIRLRIHRSVLEQALDYCAYEDFSPDGAEHYLVDFPFWENDYFYGFLLSLGDRCECLEPPQVRRELRNRAKRIAALYGPEDAQRQTGKSTQEG